MGNTLSDNTLSNKKYPTKVTKLLFDEKLCPTKNYVQNKNLKTGFFYMKNYYKKMSLKNSKTYKKMLRKSPASNAVVLIFKNLEFFISYKID